MAKRRCPHCKISTSANRAGPPGRCPTCIDETYLRLGWRPLGSHRGSRLLRLCQCTTCASFQEIPYTDVRDSVSRHCHRCSLNAVLAADPAIRTAPKIEVARSALAGGYVVRNRRGEPTSAEEVAAQMDHAGSSILRECTTCGTTSEWSLAMQPRSRRAGAPEAIPCRVCLSEPLAKKQDALFTDYNLRRRHRGYAPYGTKVKAHCLHCGAERLISATELMRGVAPCLRCMTPVDPEAPHFVYLMHFPVLGAFKIGITSSEARHDRISAHRLNGGVLVQVHRVHNRDSARTVEDAVLELVREHPSRCGPSDFPQGGHTETWAIEAGPVDLEKIIAELKHQRAPGFARIHEIFGYFARDPATIAELREFTRITVEEFDGVQVHCVGLNRPREQMLSRIRARRHLRERQQRQ